MTHLHFKWDTDTVCYQLHSDFWWSLQQIAFPWIKKWLVIKYINGNICSPLITLDIQEITYVGKLHAVLKLFEKVLYLFIFLFLPFKNSKRTQNLGLRSQELSNSVFSISASHLRSFDVRINLPLADYEAEESIFFLLCNSALFQVTWNGELHYLASLVCLHKRRSLWLKSTVLSVLIFKTKGLTNSGT